MIKKLNICLLIVFAAMIGMKAVKNNLNQRRAAPVKVAVKAPSKETVSPTIYYSPWAYYTYPNEISNRNGIILDTMRAIFPGAKVVEIGESYESAIAALDKDPKGVLVSYGRHEMLDDKCLIAPTPLAHVSLTIYLPRSSTWTYNGEESLDELRIVSLPSYLDFDIADSFAKRHVDDGKMTLLKDEHAPMEALNKLMSGEFDAMFGTYEIPAEVVQEMSGAFLVGRVKKTEPIETMDIVLHVSGKDEKLANKIIDAYEKGMKKIKESGELSRIEAYYGK